MLFSQNLQTGENGNLTQQNENSKLTHYIPPGRQHASNLFHNLKGKNHLVKFKCVDVKSCESAS